MTGPLHSHTVVPVLIGYRLNCSLDEVVDATESISDVIHRQKIFLESLLRDLHLNSHSNEPLMASDPTLVVTHGRFIKIFLKSFCSVEVEEIGNCSATRVQIILSKVTSNESEDSLATSLDTSSTRTSTSLLDNSHHRTVPWCECNIDGITYSIATVTPIEINKTSHL